MAATRQAPGGTSTICLGESSQPEATKSSNAFATGSNQNCGNVITDRPSTALKAPPGGYSTICLGNDNSSPTAPVSSNSFANGSNQNCGNVLSERSSTGLHGPPGGVSTVCLGTDANDWKAESKKLVDQTTVILGAEPSPRVNVGGEDHIVLGAGPLVLGAEQATRDVGGQDHIVFGASDDARPVTAGPSGGKDHIVFGAADEPPPVTARPSGGQGTIVFGASDEPRPVTAGPSGGQDHIVFGAADEPPLVTAGPSGGRDQIVFGASDEPRPATAGPTGGSTTICLGTLTHEWKTSSTCLVDQTEAIHAMQPVPKVDVGGEDHIILGGPPPAAVVSDPSTCLPVGGTDHIVLGASSTPVPSQCHPVGGEDHVVFGTDPHWTGKAEVLKKDASQHTERIPSGGASSVVLGTCNDAWKATSTDLAGSIILGATDVEVHQKKETESKVEDLKAAGCGKDAPTPARNGARQPPGGAATVLLG